jgi:hypothetical protein
VANGVVYVIDNLGSLHAFDAQNGAPLLKRPLMLDNSGRAAADPGSQGVAIARNTVYAASGQFVIAYRLGETDSGLGGLPELPELPGAGMSVVAGPGSVATTYLTPVVVVEADEPRLSFVNADVAPHDMDHSPEPGQKRLFESPVIGTAQTAEVVFKRRLSSGQSYGFFCSIHPNMTGLLFAQ